MSYRLKPAFSPGDRFGRLVAVEFSHRHGSNQKWLMQCDCGTKKVMFAFGIKAGDVLSCGCIQREKASMLGSSKRTHGLTQTVEYETWTRMKNRCYNPNADRYHLWGGRGIKVCSQWLHCFENFLADMGPRPSRKHSLDRINNNGDYEPGNCRWATAKEQANNRGH